MSPEEVLDVDVPNNCNEAWMDLGPYLQGVKLQYNLYTNQSYEIDIVIWPQVAQVWHGNQYAWVKVWRFLNKCWLAFTIRHLFPVRVQEFQNYVCTITPTYGISSLSSTAKNYKSNKVLFLPSTFGELRYFTRICETEQNFRDFLIDLIWNKVKEYIPVSYLDGTFETPLSVADIRHQNAIIDYVQEAILKNNMNTQKNSNALSLINFNNQKSDKNLKDKDKKKIVESPIKYGIKLTGTEILAGVGRLTRFQEVGELLPQQGQLLALISTSNLPADDDLPVFFVTINCLSGVPLDALIKSGFSEIYARWEFGNMQHDSTPQALLSESQISFNDFFVTPLQYSLLSQTSALMLDRPFEIQLRGIRKLETNFCRLFSDIERGYTAVNVRTNDVDVVLAITKINVSALHKGINKTVRGEYPLFASTNLSFDLSRETICSNDINAIRAHVPPRLIMQPHIILEAQMMLEVSLGIVGCKPLVPETSFLRFYLLGDDINTIGEVIKLTLDVNKEFKMTSRCDDLLTGFALDIGNAVFVYLEGPENGSILSIWEITEENYPELKTRFSTSNRYCQRIYAEMLSSSTPFQLMKMRVPLAALLACPQIYVHPAVPLPAKAAMLKIDRLVAGRLQDTPSFYEMPTLMELKSFNLELCVPVYTPYISALVSC